MNRDDNELLCRVEGDAPMGQLMRRHWLPACMSEEVAEPDCTPVRTRMLGEDLVVFRDTNGKLGILGEHCPHRQASLALGRNEDCGLRCLYHGWKFDVEGHVVDMACEPDAMRTMDRRKHLAYPAREAGGFVWAWMGPREEMRPFEVPQWAPPSTTRISIAKIHTAANWAQVLEGSIDSSHSSSLHSTDMPSAEVDRAQANENNWPRPSTDKAPRMQIQLTSFGFRYTAIRKPIHNADTHDYFRVTLFVAPFTVIIPPNDQFRFSQMLFPIDDTNTVTYWIAWDDGDRKGIDQEAWRKFLHARVGIELDANYRKLRTRDNWFLQDREAMKKGDFTGIGGIPAQDMAMWETMGPITDRSSDHLGASDLAVTHFRRQMVAAAKHFREGGRAIGTTEPHIPVVELSSYEGIMPKATDWRTLGVSDIERKLATADSVPA